MNDDITLVGRKSAKVRVEEYIKKQILDGRLKPGNTIKSTQQLADGLGISVPTVHLALKSLANDGWLKREHGKRTTVRGKPASLHGAKTKVCFLYSDYARNRFRSSCVEAITNYASNHNLNIRLECFEKLFESRNKDFSHELDDFFTNLISHGVTHIIREPLTRYTEIECWRAIQKCGIKCVAFNDFWLHGGPYSSVCIDDAYGVFQITEHLIALGHRRILLIDELRYWPRENAIGGFKMALNCHRLSVTEDMIMFDSDPINHGTFDSGFFQNKGFTAIICLYDFYANHLMSHFQKVGGNAENISIAVFDPTDNAQPIKFTSMIQPVELLVKKTFEILLNDSQQIIKLTFNPTLRVGDSTKPPVSSN